MTTRNASVIAELNDQFRRSIGIPVFGRQPVAGTVFLTSGIAALAPAHQIEIIAAVRDFAAFTEGNDPHREHDFASFEFADERIFWKIDYYEDGTLQYGASDPSDPLRSYRVLTIMLASEY